MVRNALLMSVATLLTIAPAYAQRGQSPGAGNGLSGPLVLNDSARNIPADYTPPAPVRPNGWQVSQMVRWGAVGKCVAAKDRATSLAYVGAHRRSREAAAAAKLLDAAFDACFAGSGVASPANQAYRRAAIADALGVRLPE